VSKRNVCRLSRITRAGCLRYEANGTTFEVRESRQIDVLRAFEAEGTPFFLGIL